MSEAVIETSGLTHWYGVTSALRNVTLAIPEGSFYALLGPNGAGKTTMLRILAGIMRPSAGQARVLGVDTRTFNAQTREQMTYVGESLELPGWMTLRELTRFLTPLYPQWDSSLAAELQRRFRLDGGRPLRALSRGEQMKAALLCALAPRPRVLLMDEPFTGMDALVKDELVGGVLDVAATHQCTVLISSHDLSELETLADTVGFLDAGILRLSESMDSVRERFRHVELQLSGDVVADHLSLPPDWLAIERSGARFSFITSQQGAVANQVHAVLPQALIASERGASLREVFVALARQSQVEGAVE